MSDVEVAHLPKSTASVYIVGGFGVFVLLTIVFHCYLKRQHNKKIKDVIMRDTVGKINSQGKIVEVPDAVQETTELC